MRSEEKHERKGDRFAVVWCFLQFLSIPDASSGINLGFSPNAKANTPTHLTHAFTALISHSIAFRLTEALKVDCVK